MRRTKSTECEGVSCSQEAKVSIPRRVGSRPRKGCARTSKGVGDVSAVGTRIGRRTSSRRATSDAGGAWLSEAGESGQLTDYKKERKRNTSHEHRAFRHFFFYYFCFSTWIPWKSNVALVFPIIFPRIEGRYRRFIRPLESFGRASSPTVEPLKKQKGMEENETPSYDAVLLLASPLLVSSNPRRRRRRRRRNWFGVVVSLVIIIIIITFNVFYP
ncbi:uncharacterized protein LOC100866700 isoform X1 [Apis florea]|uniref:uncharacterized protein LOC100866700 isoform X1 n=1 Tax=Apis florea TaxID=7463 RepID=UPI0006290D89|nr:uncharacterized protein LOC100866700 isoform X1 [Apis florea]